MTIRFQKEPQSTREILMQGISDLERVRGDGITERGGNQKATSPIRIYSLGLGELASGRRVDAAEPTGWYYFVVSGEEIESLEVNETDLGGGQRFAGAASDQETSSLVQAIGFAETREKVIDTDFEIRLLRIQGIYATCVWLKSTNKESEDLFVLVNTISDNLHSERTYSAQQLFSRMTEMAVRQIRHDDSPGKP